ncbi:MAG TPA: hypothetical protein VFP83_04670 [Candidatus Limnocylindria bacterium]|nr:hypothetical protein [Candidatus Limnocylindria bacterium]
MTEPLPTGAAETVVDPAAGVEPSDQFLSSLTAAMRRVADDARETSLADARAAIAAKIAAMRATAAARSDELRTRAEQDVAGIGEWSRAEIVRIEAETQRKVEQRRAQLTEQLDEHDRRSSAEIAALEAQVEQYEGELALFFAQLGEVTDPDTFISAARRMPRLPQTDPTAAEAPDGNEASDSSGAEEHQERLRDLGIDRNGETGLAESEASPTNGTGPEAEVAAPSGMAAEKAAVQPPAVQAAAVEPVTADAPRSTETSSEAPPVLGDATLDTSTTIAAVGLGSFGAVTTFKSALEKADGVTAVRLSLGSGGEFMYTVTHRPDLDLGDVATAALPGATVQRGADGVVQLSAGKRR